MSDFTPGLAGFVLV